VSPAIARPAHGAKSARVATFRAGNKRGRYPHGLDSTQLGEPLLNRHTPYIGPPSPSAASDLSRCVPAAPHRKESRPPGGVSVAAPPPQASGTQHSRFHRQRHTRWLVHLSREPRRRHQIRGLVRLSSSMRTVCGGHTDAADCNDCARDGAPGEERHLMPRCGPSRSAPHDPSARASHRVARRISVALMLSGRSR